MTIQYLAKDVTTVEMGIVAHGTNCSGGFGSGIAGAIKKKWPTVATAHKNLGTGKHLLGTVDIIQIKEQLYVANCYTQQDYGYDGKQYADPKMIERCLKEVLFFADNMNLPVYMPKIGCGLGGLLFENDVQPVFDLCAQLFENIEIFVCDI